MAISRMQQPQQMQGGLGSLDAPRQGYFLGKLVKKATRGIKKVFKSPLGRAALIAGGMYGLNRFGLGGAKFGKGFLTGDKAGLFTRLRSGEGFLGKTGNLFRQSLKNDQGEYSTKGNPFSYGKLGLGALAAGAVAPKPPANNLP